MKKLFLIGLTLLATTTLEGRKPYRAGVVVGAESATVSATNLVDLSRELKGSSIADLIPSYTPTSAVAIGVNLREVRAITGFAASSTTLVVFIPQTDTTLTFAGATRDDSIILFKDYLKDGGSKTKLLKAYARYSPIDPIAGNPNSLMATSANADYLLGRLSPLSGCGCWESQPVRHQFQAGTGALRAFSNGYDTTTVGLPLRYSYSPNRRFAFILDAPLTFIDNGGAYSLVGSVGMAARFPLTHRWSLTPVLRVNSGGSLDLATSGNFLSFGVTSEYQYKLSDWVLSMTNYAGYFTTTNLWLSGVNFNYNLHNYAFKNGLTLTSCKGFNLCNRTIHFGINAVDTYFAREHLYMRHWDEVGVTLFTTNVNPRLDYDCLSVGFTYQFGQKSYSGYLFNLIYQF